MHRCAVFRTAISPRCSVAAAVVLLTIGSLSAQSAPTFEQVLDRVRKYLVEYETQLSSVVADERFDQRVTYTRTYDMGRPVAGSEQRRLESEIGFIRLPGGLDWLGFRDVKKINGRALPGERQGIADMLAAATDMVAKARSIAAASAQHNLGLARTTNVPTAALEIIHPRHHARHQFTRRGDDRIDETRVSVIGFEEKHRPTLVIDPSGQELVSRGRIWIEPRTGAIWRVEWVYSPPIGAPSSIRVDFRRNAALAMMVPWEMHEEFPSLYGANARGTGRAVYSNYRRFGTGARVIPPQP
jgi:hypothetical protein